MYPTKVLNSVSICIEIQLKVLYLFTCFILKFGEKRRLAGIYENATYGRLTFVEDERCYLAGGRGVKKSCQVLNKFCRGAFNNTLYLVGLDNLSLQQIRVCII